MLATMTAQSSSGQALARNAPRLEQLWACRKMGQTMADTERYKAACVALGTIIHVKSVFLILLFRSQCYPCIAVASKRGEGEPGVCGQATAA